MKRERIGSVLLLALGSLTLGLGAGTASCSRIHARLVSGAAAGNGGPRSRERGHPIFDRHLLGRYPTLLTAPFSFVDESLAGVYGLAGITGADLRKAMLDSTQRAGLLTQPGLLAMTHSAQNASASTRGYFVQRQFLCGRVPPPASGESIGEPPADLTNRQWIEAETANASCRYCRAFFDPVGYGLGNFDAIGRFTTAERGLPVDVSGTLPVGTDRQAWVAFDGPLELAALLATRQEAQKCFARQWMQFALGRALTSPDDASLTVIESRFHRDDLSIRSLIGAVAASDAFLAP